MKTCPQCAQSWYSTYANGRLMTGYCQHCSYESLKETKQNDHVMVKLSQRHKPEEKQKNKRDWTKT